MKPFFTLVFVLVLVFSIIGCVNGESEETRNETVSEENKTPPPPHPPIITPSGCALLWGGINEISENTTLCQDTYENVSVRIMTTNLTLDCNGATLDGVNKTIEYGIKSNKYWIIIKNCSIKNYETGILIDNTKRNTLVFIKVMNNTHGIRVNHGHQNFIKASEAYYNEYGIYLYRSGNIMITHNKINNNTYGIYLENADNNGISDNNVCYNIEEDIWLNNSVSRGNTGYRSLADNRKRTYGNQNRLYTNPCPILE